MQRLTYKNPDGTFGLNNGYDMQKVPTELYGAIWKLKNYEETGLDPERVEEINDFFNSQTAKILAELQEYKNLGLTLEQLKEIDKLYLEKCQEIKRLTAELKEYKQAEDSGLIVRMPCKTGNTVYSLTPFCEICEEPLACEACCEDNCITETKFDYDMIHMFGKTVFLTREEAEQALKEKESEEHVKTSAIIRR